MSNKTKHLVDAYQQLKQQSQSAVFATIIETIGSTYQKAGSRIVITRQEKLIGLQALTNSKIAFIGLLGPAHRKQRLLKFLSLDAEKLSGPVFAPVGLDIGARTPAEIALSMMAGILAHLNQCNGQQLNLKSNDSCH